MKQFDLVIPIKTPGFSTKNRTKNVCVILEKRDEKNRRYLAVTELDDNPVSYPLIESDVELVGNLKDLTAHLNRGNA